MTARIGLILAGSRSEGDALARERRVAHRALLEVDGQPMLLRVVRSLLALPALERLIVSIDDPAALADLDELAALRASGRLEVRRSLDSPSRSVLDALGAAGDSARVLVTTADHALLEPAWVEHFLAASEARGADLGVGLVARTRIEARFPHTRRTYLRFRDGDWSGANLFDFRTPAARRGADFWQRAEALRKQPWRLALAFGIGNLLLYATRRLTLDAALQRASRVIGAEAVAIGLPFAEAAIDVDKPADLELAENILRARRAAR